MASIIEQIFMQAGAASAQGQSLPLGQAFQRGQQLQLQREQLDLQRRTTLENIETENLNQQLLQQTIRFNRDSDKREKAEALFNMQKMEATHEAAVAASAMHAQALRNPREVNTPQFQSDVATLMEENPFLLDTTQGQSLFNYMESRGVDLGIGDPLRQLEFELKKERLGVEKGNLEARKAEIALKMDQATEGMNDFERAQFQSGLEAISRDDTLVTSDLKIQAQIDFIREFRKALRQKRAGGNRNEVLDVGTQPSLAEFLFGEQPGQSDPAGIFQDDTNPLPNSIGQPFRPNRFE